MISRSVVLAAMLCASVPVVSGQGSDFAGEWSQDRAKTNAANGPFGGASVASGGFYAGLRVIQDASKLTAHQTSPDGKIVGTDVFAFDGSESSQPGAAKATSARWDGERLVTKIAYRTGPVPMVFQVTWYREGEYLVCEQLLDTGPKVHKVTTSASDKSVTRVTARHPARPGIMTDWPYDDLHSPLRRVPIWSDTSPSGCALCC